MYKYKIGQISITDFGQPAGMHLNENNRWVKKAAMIPWGEIEKCYARLAVLNGGSFQKICAFGVFAPFLAEFKRCYGDLAAESIYKLRYRAIAA